MTTRAPSTVFEAPAGLVPGLDALGTYHLLRPIGTGGMARVWLAVDSRSGRQVAVKRMLPNVALDEELRRAFIDEAELGLKLRHDNIVETLDLGEVTTAIGTEPYLALELLQGRALIELLRAAGRRGVDVPLGVIVRMLVDAARGLDYAHQLTTVDGKPLGIVHRDVSPHNIFACADGVIKLLDFGIAQSAEQSHKTRTGVIKGKLAYLTPEQIRGGNIDRRVDVFALGIVLHELLVGKPLFRGGNDAETLNRVLTLDIPAPESLRKDIPGGLGAIALRALQRDRDRRLPTAGAFADAIEAVAEAEGIVATGESVRAFEKALFPTDANDHAEDQALARRTFAHLSSSSLRALGDNPWTTPPEGVAQVPKPSLGSKVALFLAALIVTTGAAFVTTKLLSHAPRVVIAPVEPESAAPVDTRPEHPRVVEPEVAAIPETKPEAKPATKPETKVESKVAAQPRHRSAKGSLRLAAHPWAEVTLDGRALGVTPLRSTELSEGVHNVTLANHDLGVTVHRKVTIHAGQETPLVVDLFEEKR